MSPSKAGAAPSAAEHSAAPTQAAEERSTTPSKSALVRLREHTQKLWSSYRELEDLGDTTDNGNDEADDPDGTPLTEKERELRRRRRSRRRSALITRQRMRLQNLIDMIGSAAEGTLGLLPP